MDSLDTSRITRDRKQKLLDIYDKLIHIKIDKMRNEKDIQIVKLYEKEIDFLIKKLNNV